MYIPLSRRTAVLHEANSNMKVMFDDQAKVLIVFNLVQAIPGFKGSWKEAARFSTRKEWEESQFSKQVHSLVLLEMISYFWMDVERSA
jgi:hypothetical protein